MATNLARLVIVGGLFVALLSACSPSPSSTVVTPSLDAATPSPLPSVLSQGSSLTVSGRVADACIPPPESCAYWVTVVAQGGETARAEFAFDADHTSLTPGPGLPASLQPGRYALVFEVAVISDAVSPIPVPVGTPGSASPQPETACTSTLEVSDAPTVSVVVTFSRTDCVVVTRP